MAAIFCQALCKPCELLADGCGHCCTAMTRACGAMCTCCDTLCASIGRCCASCCNAFSRCCSSMCDAIGQCFSKPFSGVVFISILLSLVPFLAIIYFTFSQWGATGCSKRFDIWLLVCLILFLINFTFAIYLFRRLTGTDFSNPELNPKYDPNAHEEVNQFHHASRFFLYDPIVCLYITVGIFQFVWGIVGLAWASGAEESCTQHSQSLVSCTIAGGVILICFILIFTLGCLCSLYSGFITICMNDFSLLKCLCCCLYYPFFYSHAKTRERFYGNHNRLVPRSPQPIANGGIVVANGGVVRQNDAYQQAPPQNAGGNVYHRPAPQQYNNSPPANYQQQPQNNGVVYQQYPPQQQQGNYAPPPQYNAQQPLIAQQPPQQQYYQPPPQQFSPYTPAPQQQHQPQRQQPVSPAYQQEGVPNHPPGGPSAYAQPYHGVVAQPPVAQPVAQPIQQQQHHQQQQQPKSGVAKAADSARGAASAVKTWWNKD